MASKKRDERHPLRTPFPGIPNQFDPVPDGVPTWEPAPADAPPCPNCGAKLCMVKAPVKQSQLTDGAGEATYLGCPACPFAGPAVIVTKSKL